MSGRRLRRLLLAGVLLTLASLAAGIVYGYARGEELVRRAFARYPVEVTMEQLTPEEMRALLTVEDPNFFSHRGIDVSTPGAGWTTISQALAKELYFDAFRPGWRKVPQTLFAIGLNRRIDKRTQLTLFLNSVYLGVDASGNEVHGLGAGARAYFGRKLRLLDRDEYLALVATIVAPDRLDPRRHKEANAERVRRIQRLLDGACFPNGFRDVFYEGCR